MIHVVLLFSEVEVVNEQILVFTGYSSRFKNLLKIMYTGEELDFFLRMVHAKRRAKGNVKGNVKRTVWVRSIQ